MNELVRESPDLELLRSWTDARIGLGRVGDSLPTVASLEFSADHAGARDAVHNALDVALLKARLAGAGFASMLVQSRASNRATYLRRPDLGRQLDGISAERLRRRPAEPAGERLSVVIGDGLSSEAPMRYAVPLLVELQPRLTGWSLDCVVVAEQARVALADEIGELRGAEAVLMLLGERPGLKASDSMGAYLTYAPRVGMTDALRNCVSNIRESGLSISTAVTKLIYLLNGARALGVSGVALKENSDLPSLMAKGGREHLNEWKGLLDASAGLLER